MISKNQIKHINALHVKKYRDQERLFIAEGIKTCDEIILNDPACIEELFITRFYLEAQSDQTVKHKLKYTVVSEEELKKISTLTTPNKALTVCRYFEESKNTIDLSKQFSLYLDDIRDPGNLGTILRVADWFGIAQIFCSPHSTDLYNPKTIQAAMGAFLRVSLTYAEIQDIISDKKIPVYGAVLNGKNIYTEKLSNGLIIIGNESVGISGMNSELITHPITIPSAPSNKTESLNASMATAIVCSEFFRQLN